MSFIEGSRSTRRARLRAGTSILARRSLVLAIGALAAWGLAGCTSGARTKGVEPAPIVARLSSTASCATAKGDLLAVDRLALKAAATEAREAWAERQASFDAIFAEEIAAFHALEPELRDADAATVEVADRAEELRESFVRRCIDREDWSTSACWSGTFARDVTLALAKIRLRQGDHLAAAVEAYTFATEPDLRSEAAKLAAIAGEPCGEDDSASWCAGWADQLGEVLTTLATSRSPGHGVTWKSRDDLVTIRTYESHALLTFRPDPVGLGLGLRARGEADLVALDVIREALEAESAAPRDPAAGGGVRLEKSVLPAGALPRRVRVPMEDFGFHTSAGQEQFLAVVSTAGEPRARIVETWIDTGEFDDRGGKVLEWVMFRGTRVLPPAPGYP